MKVSLIGMGTGNPDELSAKAQRRLAEAELIIGSGRLLDGLRSEAAEKIACIRTGEMVDRILASGKEHVCAVFSGDTGFYSGAAGLYTRLKEAGAETEILPGTSSLQAFAALIGKPWQEWRLCSAHGVDCDPVHEVMQGQPVFFLTGGADGPAKLCRLLTEAGLGGLKVAVGEEFGTPHQRVYHASAEEASEKTFASLNVMLCEPAPVRPHRVPGIPDQEFMRTDVPMTKRDVRAAILSRLAVGPADVCWDIGAGTGSVGIEMALQCRQVWAIERHADALELAAKNREKLMAWNLHLLQGEAPDGLLTLPAPDAVFIGGSGGRLEEIVRLIASNHPQARLCISAIALETLETAVRIMTEWSYEPEVTQISVSGTRAVGGLHLLMAQNPVFLISGAKR